MLMRSDTDTTRKWNDYALVKSDYEGSKFVRNYIDRFNTVSFYNEYAGLMSYFFVMGQLLAPYMRIPIHGVFIDSRFHIYWIQQSRSGKSVAYEFISKILKLCEVETEVFSSGSDAKLIGTTKEVAVYDEEGKPTGRTEHEVVPGILNGYKTLLFDEASVLLNDQKAYFSDKILYLQQAMAPIGSETNVLVKHLVGGTVRTPSGVSLWCTTFPPKDIMHHVLEKGFFQRVYLYQNDVSLETRHTTSEHRLAGAYKPVPDKLWKYEDLAARMVECRDLIRDRLFVAAGITQEEWDAMKDGEREDLAVRHAYDIFKAGPSYHAALFNALDDYYGLVRGVADDNIRETAISFLPNVENYTCIMANIIAATMQSTVITAEHVMMAKEMIYDNLYNLIIWLEQKQNYKAAKKTQAEVHSWRTAFNKADKELHPKTGKEVVKKADIESRYAQEFSVSVKTAKRRLDKLLENKTAERYMKGRVAYISMNG
tara:strand:+ start:13637 stop:15085 length:1449 start_codon:yes stop_codon:yes gene_type:complete